VKIGIVDEGLLPDVGEGINGSPVVAPLTCSDGGTGMKVGVSPDAGPAYILNPDGTSCYGSVNGQDNTLAIDGASGNGQKLDQPAVPAVGSPAFGTLDGSAISMFNPGAGLIRSLSIAVTGEHKGGQDFILGWNTATGQFDPGWPAVDNDLGFLTGEVVGDVTGHAPEQEVVGGTSSLDVQAFNSLGQPASSAWPKLSGDWLAATPVLGSFGTLDYRPGAGKDVVTITRSGTLSVYTTPARACSPSSWPNWHHDIANSGDYTRDAIPPGVPASLTLSHRVLSFTAPGGDGECGRATSYQVVTSPNPITAANFARARSLGHAPAPAAAGAVQRVALGGASRRYVAIRAVDEQGNLGLPAVIDTRGIRKHARPAAACAALGPTSTLGLLLVPHGQALLTGYATDRSCGGAPIERVRVSVSRARHTRCQFLQANGRLTRPRSCSSPLFVTSVLRRARAGRRSSFTLRLRRPLPVGRWRAVAVASDAAGRVELENRWDAVAFRVR